MKVVIHLAVGTWTATERQLGAPVDGEAAGTHVTPVPAEKAGDSPPTSELTGHLDQIAKHLAEFHRRAAHRESVIDRLHEENQRLRDGLGRLLLGPVMADLIRLTTS